jgi:endonuclease-3
LKKADKINFIINTLEDLFPKLDVPLNHKDPYTLLIAVLLSAQSTDAGVNKITPILFKKADNPYDMIKLSVEEIRENYKTSGFISNEVKRYFWII